MLPPRIHSVRFLGNAHAARTEQWSLIGQDGGQSIEVGDETLFVFSDTLLSRGSATPSRTIDRATSHFLGNCAGVSNDATLDGALRNLRYYYDEQQLPREIIPATALERLAGHRFWPQHGIALDATHVHLFYLGIHQFEAKSTWGFRPLGSGLALLDVRSGIAQRVLRNDEWRLWRQRDDLRMGVQLLRDGETIYIFGSVRINGAISAIVARTRIDEIADVESYRYFASPESEWSDDVADAHPLATCAPEFSVSFNAYLCAYLMVYADAYSRELFVRTAANAWGPFGEAVCAGKLPHRERAEVVALAFEHPRFARNDGKTVLISYCQPYFTQNAMVALTFA